MMDKESRDLFRRAALVIDPMKPRSTYISPQELSREIRELKELIKNVLGILGASE